MGVTIVCVFAKVRAEPEETVVVAAIMGAAAAAAGAVVGGVADLLTYLRAALPLRDGPEGDYREPTDGAGAP